MPAVVTSSPLVVIAEVFGRSERTERALRLAILCLIFTAAFITRLFSVVRYESIIHEFDPWFNFRATKKIAADGFYSFWDWFDERSWYPLGRVVGGTIYPGLMVTAAFIHKMLWAINFPIDIRNVCVFLAPAYSTLTAYSLYLLTSELHSRTAGLFAAAFMAIAPGYISRSVAGSYDNEAISIFLLAFCFYCWIKAIKLGSAFWGAISGLVYYYMVSAWGGYVFITNMIPLHVFALLLLGRYSPKVYVAYCTWYAVGTIASFSVPFVLFSPVGTSEHMAAMGIFGLLQVVAVTEYVRGLVSSKYFKVLLRISVALFFTATLGALMVLKISGFVAPWTGRFYSLWDWDYARKHIPIISSVSEHQPTTWASLFFDLHCLVVLFPVGLIVCFRRFRNEHIFLIVYSLLASYFAGVMVRLVLTLTPIVCAAGGIAVGELLVVYGLPVLAAVSGKRVENSHTSLEKESTATNTSPGKKKRGKPTAEGGAEKSSEDLLSPKTHSKMSETMKPAFSTASVIAVFGGLGCLLFFFAQHCAWVTQAAYSSPSVVLSSQTSRGDRVIIDDFREAYYWLRRNTPEDATVMSWWDYGYQLAGMANRTTLVDNNTWNNTHIATVGRAMASSEDAAYPILLKHDVDYVLVIFGGLIGYSGDDINKFLWMVRIGQGVYPEHIVERDYFTANGEYRVDDAAPAQMRNSLMYKMSYYRFADVFGGPGAPNARDNVRGTPITTRKISLHTLDEAFTSERWLVRIYKVRKPDILGRPMRAAAAFDTGVLPRKRARKPETLI